MSSGSSINDDRGGISPSSSSGNSTFFITICSHAEVKKGSFPKSDLMDSVGESPNSAIAP